MLRFAPRLMAVFLCGAALAGCAADSSKMAAGPAEKKSPLADKNIATDLEGSIRQAQLQRAAGQYDDAIRTASQLMLVAGDDPRVASEYGKALAQKGRAQDAVEFLTRATQLAPNDWTLYSALGASYDQLGNPVSARTAYEHALMLKPNDASVLNNYALSRMMAGDAAGARIMMDRAQAAGGATDAKIAANIALVNKLAPVKAEAIAAAPKPAASQVSQAPQAAQAPVAQNTPRPASPPQAAPKPVATAALPPAPNQNTARAIVAPPLPRTAGVVMQAVPVDPLAGPVKVATRKPAAIAPKTDPAQNTKPAVTAPPLPPMPAPKAKTADKNAVPALRLTADARTP